MNVPTIIRDACALCSTYILFRLRYGFLRGLPKVASKGDVLLASLTNHLPRILMECVICAGLRLYGYRPVVLTYRSLRLVRLFFRASGVSDFVFLDDLLREARPLSSFEPLRAFDDDMRFADVFRWQHDGIDVGRHVLSTAVKRMRKGTVAFDDPQVQSMIRSLLRESLVTAKAAELLFARRTFHTLLFLERGYSPYGEFFDVALKHGVNTVQYCHAHQSDLLLLTRYDAGNRFRHPFAFGEESWKQVRERPWSEADEQAFMTKLKESYEGGTWFNRKFLLDDKKLKTPEQIRAQLELDPKKKTAIIFSHVLWDATFFFGESLFDDYETWLIETVKAACANTNVNWIVKLHPDYVWKMQPGQSPRDVLALDDAFGELPDHITVVAPDTDISTYSFFGLMDYCVTVRGTVGIEAPCFGVPVFTAGTGRYAGLGFTNDSKTREEYLDKMRRIQEFPPLSPEETSLARRHAQGLFTLRPLRMKTFEMLPVQKRGSFAQKLVIRAKNLEDLRSAEDMRAFILWITESGEEDYVRSVPFEDGK